MTYLTVILGIYALGVVPGLAAHELGHASATWLIGFPVRSIRMGHGPLLVKLPLGTARLEWRLCPGARRGGDIKRIASNVPEKKGKPIPNYMSE